MDIHIKIKELIDKQDESIILSKKFISSLDDEHAFSTPESSRYKRIFREIIDEGYTKKLLNCGKWCNDIKQYASECADKSSMQEDRVFYAFECLAYGLGWIKSISMSKTPEGNKNGFSENNTEIGMYVKKYLKNGVPRQDIEPLEVPFDIPNLTNLAKEGSIEANYILSTLFFYGIGVVADFKKSVIYMKYAAENDFAPAQCLYGRCLVRGEGTTKNEDAGMQWLYKAAKQDFVLAKRFLGDAYYNKKDYPSAEKWYGLAAKKGDVESKKKLGDIATIKFKESIIYKIIKSNFK